MNDHFGCYYVELVTYGEERFVNVYADVYFHDQHNSWTADEPVGCEIPLEDVIKYGIDECDEWINRKSYQYDDIDITGYSVHQGYIVLDENRVHLRNLPDGEYFILYQC